MAGREDEGSLAPFFDEARARQPVPSDRLLRAVMADALDVAEDRRNRRPWINGLALAASVALGFWLGAAGVAPEGLATTLWATDAVDAYDVDSPELFDLALQEG